MASTKFSVAAPEEMVHLSQARTGFARPTSLNVFQAYLGLKELFGEPNREYIDEDKQQWVYLLKTEGAKIEVNDWKLESWSVHVYENNNDEGRASSIITQLEQQLARAYSKHRSEYSSALKSPVGHAIENPFALYYETANDLLNLATQINESHRKKHATTQDIGDWSTQYTLCRTALLQFIASVEGLLNLIYEIFLRPELRDDRLMEHLLREQIDVKIRLAPIYCSCFKASPLNHKTDAFKNYLRIVNVRNDFVHANVTKTMKFPVVNFDETTFVVSTETADSSALLPGSMSEINLDDVSRTKAIIDQIVNEIVSSMKPSHRRNFKKVLSDIFIDVEYKDGQPKILVW